MRLAFTTILFLFSVVAMAQESCQFSKVETERLREFVNVKKYLTENVFPYWESEMPQMFVFDLHCQYALNQKTGVPEGFKQLDEPLNIAGFTSTIFSRPNLMKTPFGEEMPFQIGPAGFTSTGTDGTAWFTMALYDVWKKEFGDKLEFYFGMLAHESFHPFQFKFAKIKAVMSGVSEDTFTNYYKKTPEFHKMADQELLCLRKAILSKDVTVKKKMIREFFSVREKRRVKFFTGEMAAWTTWEPGAEAIEGVAEYMNFRVMTDSKNFPMNEKLKSVDPDYTHYKTFAKFTLTDALDAAAKTKSYTQKIGVYKIVLLNQLMPNWQAKIFDVDGFSDTLLQELAR